MVGITSVVELVKLRVKKLWVHSLSSAQEKKKINITINILSTSNKLVCTSNKLN
jgi:hypothetical protein